jgi:hypothetical protein
MSDGKHVSGRSLQVQNWLRTVSRSRLWINSNEHSDSDTDKIYDEFIFLFKL